MVQPGTCPVCCKPDCQEPVRVELQSNLTVYVHASQQNKEPPQVKPQPIQKTAPMPISDVGPVVRGEIIDSEPVGKEEPDLSALDDFKFVNEPKTKKE